MRFFNKSILIIIFTYVVTISHALSYQNGKKGRGSTFLLFKSRRSEYLHAKKIKDQFFVQEIESPRNWKQLKIKSPIAQPQMHNPKSLNQNTGNEQPVSIITSINSFKTDTTEIEDNSKILTEELQPSKGKRYGKGKKLYTEVMGIDNHHERSSSKKNNIQKDDLGLRNLAWHDILGHKELRQILSSFYLKNYGIKGNMDLDFYGVNIKIAYNGVFPSLKEKISSEKKAYKAIASFIKDASASHAVNEWLEQISLYAKIYDLNDWAKYLFFKKSLESIYPRHKKSEKSILLGYALLVNGYDVKYSYDNKSKTAYVLISSDDILYGERFIQINDRHYYLMNPSLNSSKLTVYTLPYYENSKALDFSKPLSFTINNEETRSFLAEYRTLSLTFNSAIAKFYDHYPNIDLAIKLYTPFSKTTWQSVKHTFGKRMSSLKTTKERISYLLDFVQKGFKYQQNDKRTPLFPEQALNKTHIGSETRSALFLQLVKALLGLEVMAFNYSGHIVVGVYMLQDVAGAKIYYDGKLYVICDPSYINAGVGMITPGLEDITPKAITPDTKQERF